MNNIRLGNVTLLFFVVFFMSTCTLDNKDLRETHIYIVENTTSHNITLEHYPNGDAPLIFIDSMSMHIDSVIINKYEDPFISPSYLVADSLLLTFGNIKYIKYKSGRLGLTELVNGKNILTGDGLEYSEEFNEQEDRTYFYNVFRVTNQDYAVADSL